MAKVGRLGLILAILAVVSTAALIFVSNRLLALQQESQSRDSSLSGHHFVRVQIMDLGTKVSLGGTLTYASVVPSTASMLSGVVTNLPKSGSVISRGQVLYELNNEPVVLMYGQIPEWRSLQLGSRPGADVSELEANLTAIGYNLPQDGAYSYSVARAVSKFFGSLGMDDPTGKVDLGRILYLSGPVRVQGIVANLGSSVSQGTQVLSLATTSRQVMVDIPSSVGAAVAIGQPARVNTGGVATALAGVVVDVQSATDSASSSSQSRSSTVQNGQRAAINLSGPNEDLPPGDVPVQVEITTQVTKAALVVPVTAVIALSEGGYALNADDGKGHYHLVSVTLGAYDDVDALIQVNGPAVSPGLQVVSPS
jgi:hypothetical protein